MTQMAAAASALIAADPLYDSARHKLDLIETRQVPPGATVAFPVAEINAWARVKVPEIVPEGLRKQRVELANGAATGYALADFLKMRQAKGAPPNWFVAKLLEGERPLKVSVRIESGGGRCTVHVTSVEIGGVAANGSVLDVLIKTFFLPLYPEAKINEPFDLDYNIDRIDILPTQARATIKKASASGRR
jgi:hypothetical protein